MKRRLVAAIYWFVLGANALLWLSELMRRFEIGVVVAMLAPFAVLPVIRWVKTGEWHVDPR